MPQLRRTPILSSVGQYTFKAPFDVSIPIDVTYTCVAIRSFSEITINEEASVYTLYYEPAAISDALYREDSALGACIVTLRDTYGRYVYVPDTFIVTLPDLNTVPYTNLIASVSIGALPDAFDVTFLIERITDAVESGLGIQPVVKVHKVPSTGVISQEQHALNELARTAAITNNETKEGRIVRLTNLVAEQHQKIVMLEQLCVDNGLFEP